MLRTMYKIIKRGWSLENSIEGDSLISIRYLFRFRSSSLYLCMSFSSKADRLIKREELLSELAAEKATIMANKFRIEIINNLNE